ncbi:MAG: pyridoxal phosphate-dependent aminotransferase [Candidatus Omnitrophica bacterium]|nr:pyridoxal phosphate-dependent aminotransferase [Candidatus Omnitrophota bacterium]MDD5487365.1 pyridoxal phosphate-dependent aminotransferase [Candidatus Omnitrophota bacterium]
MLFSEKISRVKPSATLGITSKAKAMKAKGEDVVILAAGEPDFDTPNVIKEAAIKAINDGFTKYTPSSGTNTLKEAIAHKLKKDNSLEYAAKNIVVSCGAKHSIYNVLQVICNPGDEVLIISPYWLSYPEMVVLAGAVPKIISPEDKTTFKVSPEDIRRSVGPRTKVIILNSPSNPAGVVYEENEIRAIAGVCLEAGLTVVSDEIYEKIIFDGREHFSIAQVSEDMKRATVVVNGMSKSYSMTGWRIGYIAADEDIVKRVGILQDHSTSNPCSISQVAAEFALKSDLGQTIKDNSRMFQKRRDILLGFLNAEPRIRPIVPLGAFYMFCDISGTGLDSMVFAEKVLEDRKVAVIPGGPFGDDKSIRISFATDEATICRGAERVIDFIRSF